MIAKQCKPAARLTVVRHPRKPVDLSRLHRLTGDLAQKGEDAAHTLRKLRDQSRY